MTGPALPVFALSRLRMASDGPGVTTLVGVLGCPLACRYCINPHARRSNTAFRDYSVDALLEALRIDQLYFVATGGGVTFGGGEPLMHGAFLAEFGRQMPGDWKMNIETSLNVPASAVEAVLPRVDRLIVDVKDMNAEIYRAYTGRENGRVLDNLRLLAAHPEKVFLRVPRIEGFNAADDTDRSAALLRGMGFHHIERFTYILPGN